MSLQVPAVKEMFRDRQYERKTSFEKRQSVKGQIILSEKTFAQQVRIFLQKVTNPILACLPFSHVTQTQSQTGRK